MNVLNLNDLLEAQAPAAIAELRTRFPNAEDQFRADMTLGDTNLANANSRNIAAARIAHIELSVPVLRAELDKNLDQLGSAMRRARRIQFTASAVTAASSGGLVTAILKIGPLAGDSQAILLSGISFFGSLLALGADLVTGGKEFDSRGLFDQCASMSKELLDVELKARRQMQSTLSADALESLLDRLDALAVGVQETGLRLKLH